MTGEGGEGERGAISTTLIAELVKKAGTGT